jgi:small-conductance mechanosensitive channel
MFRTILFIVELVFFLIIFYLKWNNIKLIESLGFDRNYFEILYGCLLYLIGVDLLERIARFLYKRKQKLNAQTTDNFIIGIGNIHTVLVVLGIIATILAFFDIDFKSLITTLSIVAAALAIITRDYISNFLSGMIISFSNMISIGDRIKIKDIKGRVHDITLSYIHLISDDEELISIPSNLFFVHEIVNYTKRDIKKISIEFELKLRDLPSVEQLEQDLINALVEYHKYVENNSFYLRIITIKKDSITFKFQYVLRYQNHNMERDIRRITVRSIVKFIKQYKTNFLHE